MIVLKEMKGKRAARTARVLTTVAQHMLKTPHHKVTQACKACQVPHSVLYNHLRYTAPERFLREWGGELATDERVTAVLKSGLRLQHGRIKNLATPEGPAPLTDETHESLKTKLRLANTTRYLGAHECQMLVDGMYCKEPVTGLYCAPHDALAARQVKAGFARAQGR